jgi:hypothetical protein
MSTGGWVGSTSKAVTSLQRLRSADGLARLAMFKLPAFDPVAITVIGAGILLIAVLALAH